LRSGALASQPFLSPYPTLEELRTRAAGSVAYPWELTEAQQPKAWAHSRARNIFRRCLARRPEECPSTAALVMSLHRFNAVSMQGSRHSGVREWPEA